MPGREFIMKRILIIGCCGAGKTTLALELGDILNLPVHHLDRLWWRSGWTEESTESFDAKLAEILVSERWIIDGNYKRTLQERLKYADTVIFLNYSRWLCLWRVLTRIIRLYGQSRPDVGGNCPERFDWKFIRYVWNFNREMRPRVESAMQDFKGEIVVMNTPKKLKQWQKLILSVIKSRIEESKNDL